MEGTNDNYPDENSEDDTQYIIENTDDGLVITKVRSRRRQEELEAQRDTRIKTIMRNSGLFAPEVIDASRIKYNKRVYYSSNENEIEESPVLSEVSSNDGSVFLKALSYQRQGPFLFTQRIDVVAQQRNNDEDNKYEETTVESPLGELEYDEPTRYIHSQDTYLPSNNSKKLI